ncbi:MAG: thiamine phosphate synthase [Gammaproteobacteria bacterium]|nr:thiamine phosphate synthase [Gammaproteobacteria bacterium]
MNASRVRGLYAIADTRYLEPTRLLDAVEQALKGGARVVQYRDKSSTPELRQQQAQLLARLCKNYGVLFIINDDVELARSTADGVHLGRDDMPLTAARERLGAGMIVGVSCYNELARAQQAAVAGADYVAFGSFFPSITKPNAARADIGLLDAARTLPIPLVAIGGITPENGALLVAAGVDALAVISGVFDQADVQTAAKRYANLFKDRELS